MDHETNSESSGYKHTNTIGSAQEEDAGDFQTNERGQSAGATCHQQISIQCYCLHVFSYHCRHASSMTIFAIALNLPSASCLLCFSLSDCEQHPKSDLLIFISKMFRVRDFAKDSFATLGVYGIPL